MTEAKDTVLSYLKVSNQIPMTLLEFIAKLEEQAEISFRAGTEESDKLWCGALQEAGLDISHPSEIIGEVSKLKNVGRREVVEWFKNNYHGDWLTHYNQWQAKWGIK